MSSNSVSAGENLVAGTAGDEAMPSDQKKKVVVKREPLS
jgi:hypothetical protein